MQVLEMTAELEILLKGSVGHSVDRTERQYQTVLPYSFILKLPTQFSISSFGIIVFGNWVTVTKLQIHYESSE